MHSHRLPLLGLISLLLIGLSAFFLWPAEDKEPMVNGPNLKDALALETRGALTPEQQLEPGLATTPVQEILPQGSSERTSLIVMRTIAGSVTNAAGVPIEGARISWTPDSLLLERNLLCEGTWQAMRDAMSWAETNADGDFAMGLPAQPANGVIWVTKLGRMSQFHWLPKAEIAPLLFALDASEDLACLVSNQNSAPVQEAMVIHRGTAPRDIDAARWSDKDRATQLYLRSFEITPLAVSLPQRTVHLPNFDHDEVVWAEGPGKTLSEIQPIELGEAVELELAATFTLFATVRHQGGQLAVRPHLKLSDPGESGFQELYSFDENGSLEVLIPLGGNDHFQAILLSPDFAVVVKEFARPNPGAQVRLDFQGTNGHEVPVHFVDDNGESIPDVHTSLSWENPSGSWSDNWPAETSNEFGRVTLRSVLESQFYIYAEHEDFAEEFQGPFTFANLPLAQANDSPGATVAPIVFQMQRSALVSGYVIGSGEKQTGFTLQAWKQGDPASYQLPLTVEIAEDGRFSFKAPASKIMLMAWKPGFAQSISQAIDPSLGTAGDLELHLPAAVVGSGRVLDAATRLPLAGASFETVISGSGMPIGHFPNPLLTGTDGAYEVFDLSPNEMALVAITLDGYKSTTAAALPEIDTSGILSADFGDVFLGKSSTFDITVTGYEGPLPLVVAYHYNRDDTTELQSATGGLVATSSGFSGGLLPIELIQPDGTILVQTRQHLFGSGPWSSVIDVGNSTSLEVSFQGLSNADEIALVQVSSSTTIGNATLSKVVTPADHIAGSVRITGPIRGGVSLVAVDAEGFIVAMGLGMVEPGSANHAQLDDVTRALTLIIVDGNGDPVPGIRVYAAPASAPGSTNFRATTNAEGLANIGPVPFDLARCRIVNSKFGITAFDVQVPTDDTPVTIIVEPSKRLRFQVTDHGEPLSGLAMRTFFHTEQAPILRLVLDAAGTYDTGPVHDADFDCFPASPWVWPQWHTVHSTDTDQEPVQIELRRRGDLIVRILATSGAPLTGVPIALRSTEFNQHVSDMLGEGFARTGPTGLITDSNGEVLISGLPNGHFTWTANSVGLEGSVMVPAFGKGLAIGQVVE